MRDIELPLGDDVLLDPRALLGDPWEVGSLALVLRGEFHVAVADGEQGVKGAGDGEPLWVVLKSVPLGWVGDRL